MASNEDTELNRALAASMEATFESTVDAYEELPPKERARVPGHPVAVRGRSWIAAFIGHIFEAFLALPEVRRFVQSMRFEDATADMDQAAGLQTTQKILAYLDGGNEAYITVDEILGEEALRGPATQDPGSRTVELLRFICEAFSAYEFIAGLSTGETKNNLFGFTHGLVNQPDETHPGTDLSVHHRHDSLDLVTALEREFTGPFPWKVLHVLPHVFAFHVVHDQDGFPAPAEKKSFRYPPVFYADRYIFDNAWKTKELATKAVQNAEAAEALKARRKALTELNGRDTRKDLRASLHYLSEVAPRDGTADRKTELENAKAKLSKILAKVENDIDTIDSQIAGLQKETSTLFDTPDMQQYRYDLRVVFFHDGLYTRTHVWSYVKDDGGKWWKFQDASVTEVDETTVLNDSAGLHMGAGPYMLFYGRASDEAASVPPAEWPADIARYVEAKNFAFESELKEGGEGVGEPMDLS
ncbi:hypothetical protein EXIGLDRAFT_156502 [Exidia glandulosa HHB12029]|uniref:USP domain-containing protein n=1 Tax=Exidia glandulosa HHB12029 TaxID=1314781 RepID=A0A165N8G8_EXIGL|nr:hypothetical protein EXIGLDRAFT_156502 [Exidia glandulosa HHB12029]